MREIRTSFSSSIPKRLSMFPMVLLMSRRFRGLVSDVAVLDSHRQSARRVARFHELLREPKAPLPCLSGRVCKLTAVMARPRRTRTLQSTWNVDAYLLSLLQQDYSSVLISGVSAVSTGLQGSIVVALLSSESLVAWKLAGWQGCAVVSRTPPGHRASRHCGSTAQPCAVHG